jgi:poly(3-hydroxybutyrate) depolymerase
MMRYGLRAILVPRRAVAALWVLPLTLLSAAHAAEPAPVAFVSSDGTELKAWLLQPASIAPDAMPAPRRATIIALHGCGGLYATSGQR